MFCFKDVDIMWYHRLLTPIEFEHQSPRAACFDQQVERKIKIKHENKIKVEIQTVLLMDQQRRQKAFRSGIVLTWYLRCSFIFEIHLVINCFYFFIYFLFRNDVMLTVVCKFEIPCEYEIL